MPIDDLANLKGWALINTPRSFPRVAHWIDRVDQALGPGQRIQNIHGTGFHAACGLVFGVAIAFEPGDRGHCANCERALLRRRPVLRVVGGREAVSDNRVLSDAPGAS